MRSNSDREPTFAGTARKAQIVGCAIEVIAELGYAQASVRKIADRVGIAMSAVLYHFGNKDNLVDAVIEEMYRTALALVVPKVDAAPTPSAKLDAYIRSSLEYFGANRVQLLALAQLGTSYQPRDGRTFGDLGQGGDVGGQLAALDPASILRDGQAAGEFTDFSVESMTIALRGAVSAVVEPVLRDPDFDVHGYGEDLVQIFGRSVRGTE